MPRWFGLVCLLGLLLGGCGTTAPGSTAVLVPPAETPLAVATLGPTPDITKIDFTPGGIQQALLVAGDLPPSVGISDVFDESPVDYSGPKPQFIVNLKLKEGNNRLPTGSVYFWSFKDEKSAQEAYQHRIDLLKFVAQDTPAFGSARVGNESLSASGEAFAIPAVVFRRCASVVEIKVGERNNRELGMAYADKLDQRLSQIVC